MAIPLAGITAQRVSYLYELMDAAYDAKAIVENSRMAGRILLIDSNPRSGKEAKAERATERRRLDCLNLSDAKDQRYNERTNAERAIRRLKDESAGSACAYVAI